MKNRNKQIANAKIKLILYSMLFFLVSTFFSYSLKNTNNQLVIIIFIIFYFTSILALRTPSSISAIVVQMTVIFSLFLASLYCISLWFLVGFLLIALMIGGISAFKRRQQQGVIHFKKDCSLCDAAKQWTQSLDTELLVFKTDLEYVQTHNKPIHQLTYVNKRHASGPSAIGNVFLHGSYFWRVLGSILLLPIINPLLVLLFMALGLFDLEGETCPFK